jgi:hypothetical protein
MEITDLSLSFIDMDIYRDQQPDSSVMSALPPKSKVVLRKYLF